MATGFCPDTTCSILLNSRCVFYEAASLPYTGINTNDSLQVALQKLENVLAGVVNPSVEWGEITGNIGNQTDLINYLADNYTPQSRILTINGTAFNLSADRVWNVGTVTAVTASLPLSSSGGNTPDISISQASGSTDGYLSSIDWNTFNNKQDTITASNGLTKVSDDIRLGGSITSNTSLTGTDTNLSAIMNVTTGGSAEFKVGAFPVAEAYLLTDHTSTIGQHRLIAASTGIEISVLRSGVNTIFRINNSAGAVFTDQRAGTGGIRYAAAGYVTDPRSLTDKAYVDAAVAAILTDGDKGDITVSGSGTIWTIDNSSVTYAKIQDSAVGLTVLGRASNTSGVFAEIVAGSDETVLRRSGTSIGFGQITTGGITDDAVTYAKIQNVVSNNVFLGRISGAGGNVEELTGTQATTLLDVFTSGLKGLTPASGGGTSNFLRADGTWAIPSGTGISTLNTLTATTQTFATGTSGSDFNISSVTSTHTFNIPTASAINRGALSSSDWSTFNGKLSGTVGNNQVLVGTGTAVTSFSGFTYDNNTGQLVVPASIDVSTLIAPAGGNNITVSASAKVRLDGTTGVTLTNTPSTDNALTAVLVRDAATGDIKIRTASTLGITNGAANTEIPKSDGTNLVSSKVFISSNGNLTLGDSGLSGDRTINAVNSGSDADLILSSQSQIFFGSKAGDHVYYQSDIVSDVHGFVSSHNLILQASSTYNIYLGGNNSANIGIGGIPASWGTSQGTLGILNRGAAPSAALTNGILIYAQDSSDGSANSTLALYTEQAPEASATFTQTHRFKIWINGTEFWLSLDAV